MGTEVIPTQQPQYSNVRRWPRYRLNVPLRVILEKGDKTKIIHGRGTELNGGGLALFAGIELALGAIISIEFTPPYSGEPIRARCAVRDRNGSVYGLEFIAELPEDGGRIDQIRAALKAMGERMA